MERFAGLSGSRGNPQTDFLDHFLELTTIPRKELQWPVIERLSQLNSKVETVGVGRRRKRAMVAAPLRAALVPKPLSPPTN